MIKRIVISRLDDIIDAIGEVDDYLEGRDFGFYERSSVTRRAVERCIEIVSEASRHVPLQMQERYASLPWPAIRGIGNKLRHEYRTVDNHLIWLTAVRHLPELRRIIVEMRRELLQE